MDKNRNSGTNGMGGLNPDWRPSTIGALSRALSSGWQSPAMRAEENAENSRMMPSAPGIRNVVSPGASAASDSPEEWRFGQPSDLRKLVQRLQTGNTEEASSTLSYEANPLINSKQNSKTNNQFGTDEGIRFDKHKERYLLKAVRGFREFKRYHNNPARATIKNLLAELFTYIPKKAIKNVWEFAANPESKPNISSLIRDYEKWLSKECPAGKQCAPDDYQHLYSNYSHIPWKYFENYDKRMPGISREAKLKDWIHDRPELWTIAMLRRGDWTKEDIDLLTELIDLTAGLAL